MGFLTKLEVMLTARDNNLNCKVYIYLTHIQEMVFSLLLNNPYINDMYTTIFSEAKGLRVKVTDALIAKVVVKSLIKSFIDI